MRTRKAAADMLGTAGKSALGAVATGLMVNNPQEMSRVTRLLFDMVCLPNARARTHTHTTHTPRVTRLLTTVPIPNPGP